MAESEELVDWCGLWAAWRLPVVLALPGSERIAAEAALQALLQRQVPLLVCCRWGAAGMSPAAPRCIAMAGLLGSR